MKNKKIQIDSNVLNLSPSIMHKLPVFVLEDAVAVPNITQQLPQTVIENQPIISRSIEKGEPVVVIFNSEHDSFDPTAHFSGIGIVGKILKYEKSQLSEEQEMIIFEASERVKIQKISTDKKGDLYAKCEVYPISFNITAEDGQKLIREMQPVYERIMQLSGRADLQSLSEILRTCPFISAFFYAFFSAPVDPYDKDQILALPSISEIMNKFLVEMHRAEQFLIFRADIQDKVQKEMNDVNRENFLRQEIAVIRDELGEGDKDDIEEFYSRSKDKKWSKETGKHFEKELKRLQRYPANTPDYSVQSTYLDNFLSLPWKNYANSDFDFEHVAKILDRDHFGLEKVKERVLEQMAVAKLRADNRAPILCLVGPPGVGKTSLGRSIAEATGREYCRVSFGGMHDEAEIRGHRRTYIGAMPGRIISSLMKTETSNPVMVLDEIDKIGKDFKGDPSMALLEVLDPEQNYKFHDNYLDADYDLSNILFIATANSLESVSAPLLDRMEIISIPGYITAEKVEIAKRHLLPKALKANGFEENEISFSEDALIYITDYFTRESGVRKLEKTISKILRKLAVLKVRGIDYPKVIERDNAQELLGKEEYNPDMYENNDAIGVVTGLAWTSVGGEILFIESSITDGKGKLTLTGNLGDVMKESATLALQLLKSHAKELAIDPDRFEKTDVHIHVPEGAIPKDGPSAGITLTTSLVSSFTGRKVRPRLAMTGEITLRGKILPVGGIKEKIIAAKRAGIIEIILSKENEKDIEEIASRYVEGLKFTFVDNISQVIERALV